MSRRSPHPLADAERADVAVCVRVLQVIISKFNEIDANHYLDPRSNQTFQFDHVRQVASDLQPSGQAADSTRCVSPSGAQRPG